MGCPYIVTSTTPSSAPSPAPMTSMLTNQGATTPKYIFVTGGVVSSLGKGIAGEAAATGKPVTLCNLQTDASGVARPGAKATGLGGSLCVPAFDGDRVVGTLGIGWMGERAISDDETATLLAAGRALAPALSDR